MIIEILFVVAMFLWFLTTLPFPQTAPYAGAGPFLAFFCVLLLGITIFAGHVFR